MNWDDDDYLSPMYGKWNAVYPSPAVPASSRRRIQSPAVREEAQKNATHPVPQQSIGVRTEEQADTITAYKFGHFVIQDKQLMLKGQHSAKGYGIDAEAVCAAQGGYYPVTSITLNPPYNVTPPAGSYTVYPQSVHTLNTYITNSSYSYSAAPFVPHDSKQTPHENCECGFYAYSKLPDSDDPYSKNGRALLFEVELYGKVVVHQRGMRASNQRITQIRTPSCSHHLCKNKTTRVSILTDYQRDPLIPTFDFRCDEHESLVYGFSCYSMPLAQVAGQLGTEVISREYEGS